MTDVGHDTMPAALSVADTTLSLVPVNAAATNYLGPPFELPPVSDPIGCDASAEVNASLTAVDTPIDQHPPILPDFGGNGGGRDGEPSEAPREAGDPDEAIRFQTYHSDLLMLRDITATMLPTPIAARPDAKAADIQVSCEAAPDGLRIAFLDGPVTCRIQAPFAGGTAPSGAGRFQIPAQILRLAALQAVKNKPKPKKATTHPLLANTSLAPRATYQGIPDRPADWTIKPRTSDGRLLYGGTDLNFTAPTDTSTPWEEESGLSEPISISPDRICAALRAAKPGAATRIDALPRLSQVTIDDGVAYAFNQRLYAFHSDPALAPLSFRVAESDISKLLSLMRHLDPTSTTFRTSGRACVFQDARLVICFTQPFDALPVIKSRSLLEPTLAMQCEHAELTRLVDIALCTAGADQDAHRRLQLHLRMALIDGQIALKMDAAWKANRFRRDGCSVMMEPEQASNLRRRLSLSAAQTRDLAGEHAADPSEDHGTASSIELGRYVASDLLRVIRTLRSGLLRLEFIEGKALFVSEIMAEHRTDYVLVSRTQDDTHGLPARRSKRWDAPSLHRT